MLRLFFAPLRFTVFVLLGAFVMFGVTHCVPEQSDINPPQKWEKSY